MGFSLMQVFIGKNFYPLSDLLHCSRVKVGTQIRSVTLFSDQGRHRRSDRLHCFQIKVGTAGQTGYIVSRSRSVPQVRPVILFPGKGRHRRSDRLYVSTSIFLEFQLLKTLFYPNSRVLNFTRCLTFGTDN